MSEWNLIENAPKDGTRIVGWFVTNEVVSPSKSKPAICMWKINQFKDATEKKVGKPFGLWESENWNEPMSYAPTHWMPLPESSK
jgi:hypothetical protein